MTRVKISGKLLESLRDIVSDLEDRRELLSDIGEILTRSTTVRFSTQRDPDMRPWEKSLRAIRENNQTLVRTGRLKNSIRYYSDNNEVNIGTDVPYGAVHQFGAQGLTWTVPETNVRAHTRNGRSVRAHRRRSYEVKANVPRRAFLGVSKIDQNKILTILEDYVNGEL